MDTTDTTSSARSCADAAPISLTVTPFANDRWQFSSDALPDPVFPLDIDFGDRTSMDIVFRIVDEDFYFARHNLELDLLRAPISFNVNLDNSRKIMTLTINLLEPVEPNYLKFDFQLGCRKWSDTQAGVDTLYYSQDPKIRVRGNE